MEVDPEILGGTPCIRGTRLNVYAIAARLTGQETADGIVAENPWVTVEMVHAALAYAGKYPLVEHPDARPWRVVKRQMVDGRVAEYSEKPPIVRRGDNPART